MPGIETNDVGLAADSITTLHHSTNMLAKVWQADGSIKPYDEAKNFTYSERPLSGIRDLSDFLTGIESDPHMCVIRGHYNGPREITHILRRRVLFDDAPHHWALIEVDNFEPICADPVLQPEEAIEEYVTTHLPAEFWLASCHWQLSSSAGHPKNAGKLKVHLWFWFDKAYDSEQLKRWAKRFGIVCDRAVMNVVQVHYTAAPQFAEGVTDPVPRRSGFVRGLLGDEVALVMPEDCLTVPEAVIHDVAPSGDYPLLQDLLATIDPEKIDGELPTITDAGDWLAISMAVHHETGGSEEGYTLWDGWCARDPARYDQEANLVRWDSFSETGSGGAPVTIGTVKKIARTHFGWDDPAGDDEFAPPPPPPATGEEEPPPLPAALTHESNIVTGGKDNGKLRPLVATLAAAFARPDLTGFHLAWDAFEQCEVLSSDGGATWEPLTDATLHNISYRLQTRMRFRVFAPIAKELLRDAVHAFCRGNIIDTAQNWLNALVWDGVPRIDSFFEDYFGGVLAADRASGYARALSAYTWTALAGRNLQPGVKADITPILIGEQGIRKTTVLEAMCPYPQAVVSVHLGNIGSDDLVRKMRGKLIGEISELRGLHTKDLQSIKDFMTAARDELVPKFHERAIIMARRLLFVGTSNENDILADPTGNRRWAPIEVGQDGASVDTDAIVAVRDQLWAEGAARFRANGIEWQPLDGPQGLLNSVHVRHKLLDPIWLHDVGVWLGQPRPTGIMDGADEGGAFAGIGADGVVPTNGDGFVLTAAIYKHALGFKASSHSAPLAMKLEAVMGELGYVKSRRVDGNRGWKKRPDYEDFWKR